MPKSRKGLDDPAPEVSGEIEDGLWLIGTVTRIAERVTADGKHTCTTYYTNVGYDVFSFQVWDKEKLHNVGGLIKVQCRPTGFVSKNGGVVSLLTTIN